MIQEAEIWDLRSLVLILVFSFLLSLLLLFAFLPLFRLQSGLFFLELDVGIDLNPLGRYLGILVQSKMDPYDYPLRIDLTGVLIQRLVSGEIVIVLVAWCLDFLDDLVGM